MFSLLLIFVFTVYCGKPLILLLGVLAILVPYKMVASMWKLYTFQYSIWSYAHRGKGSIGGSHSNFMSEKVHM